MNDLNPVKCDLILIDWDYFGLRILRYCFGIGKSNKSLEVIIALIVAQILCIQDFVH